MKYDFIQGLNEEQKRAATTVNGPMLILAGAGSGKTKTIVSRTAFLIAEQKALASEILVMTFTNKAAKEMRERGDNILKDNGLWDNNSVNFTTFHSWGYKFLRKMSSGILENYKFNSRFSLCSGSSQVDLFKLTISQIFNKEDSKLLKAKDFILLLGNMQSNLIPYDNIETTKKGIVKLIKKLGKTIIDKTNLTNCTKEPILKLAELYIKYKELLRINNLLDFEDLINISIKILEDYPLIKEDLHNRYKFIMVDEFQDTNGSQITLLNLLINKDSNICVVGDDSQSIYSWRGADIGYILNFQDKRENTKRFNLKINYRSKQKIVKQANALLENSTQKHKFKEELVAFNKESGEVSANFFPSGNYEAKYISNTIRKLLNNGAKFKDITILYRANYINRALELELISNSFKYKIHNGKSLLERKATREALNYINLLENQENMIALQSVLIASKILTISRVAQIIQIANLEGLSLLEYIQRGIFTEKGLTSKIKDNLKSFAKEFKKFQEKKESLDFVEFAELFCEENCINKTAKDIVANHENGSKKVSENILKTADSVNNNIGSLKKLMKKFNNIEDFLEASNLDSQEQTEDNEDIDNHINLMTIHASKGLEFENVFVIGLSSEIFPAKKSFLEEERRLAYVAMTRAKKRLFLSGASFYLGDNFNTPSSFFYEAQLEVKIHSKDTKNDSSRTNNKSNLYKKKRKRAFIY